MASTSDSRISWVVVCAQAVALLAVCAAIAVAAVEFSPTSRKAPLPPAVAPTVTVRVAPPSTVTVQAAPSVPAPIGPTALPLILPPTIEVVPAQDDFVADQRMLDSIRASGYTVYDAQSVLRNAHEVCRLFRQGKSVDEVNQQMAAETGASMADVLQLSSSAMLSYPNCS